MSKVWGLWRVWKPEANVIMEVEFIDVQDTREKAQDLRQEYVEQTTELDQHDKTIEYIILPIVKWTKSHDTYVIATKEDVLTVLGPFETPGWLIAKEHHGVTKGLDAFLEDLELDCDGIAGMIANSLRGYDMAYCERLPS